ncbi:UNVERIFIED_CONTAM: hypothetical protein GTU68_015071 [Idotea baltica]|nr:hypothetical protein [Idotea baltica]
MEGENVEDAICAQPSFKSETEAAKSSEENPLVEPIDSSVSELNILLPPPPSPPFRPLGPPEALRNVQDATEYHKPTLLGKNIKAKKHAKLQICRQCDQVFSNRQALIRHIERRHKSVALTHSCDTCHKKFNSERTLKQHNRSHKTYPCKVCSKIFLKKTKLKKHLEEHTQKKTFVCAICSKNFTCKRNLDHHSLIHSGEKPFSCENCGKGFRNRSNMVNHYNVCIGKLPFPCTLCRKAFSRPGNYKLHMRTHTGERPYQCKSCGKAFTSSSNYKRHLKCHVTHAQLDDSKQSEDTDIMH